jgi:hypothetical protein
MRGARAEQLQYEHFVFDRTQCGTNLLMLSVVG